MSLGVAAAAVGVTSLGSAGASIGGGPIAQQVLGSGSDTTQIMMGQLSTLYQFSPGCSSIPQGLNPPNGGNAWYDFSCQAPDPSPINDINGTSKNGFDTVTLATSTDVSVGMEISGPGLDYSKWPQGIYVGKISGNVVTLTSSPVKALADVFADNAAGNPAGTGSFHFSNVTRTENYEHDQAASAYFLGSSNGIHQLCNQNVGGNAHVDYARSSRATKSGDCTGLHFVDYAQDGITWEAFNVSGSGVSTMNNTEAPCSGGVCLTQSDIHCIWVGGSGCTGSGANGCIINWSDVGGPNLAMDVYTPQSGSGTRSTWDSFVGGSSDGCINANDGSTAANFIIPENANTPILNAGDRANAIFPFSIGVWNTTVKGASSAVLGKVDGVAPTAANITNGSFPYTRQLFNVWCAAKAADGTASGCAAAGGQSSQATVNFVGEEGWICKPAAPLKNSSTLTGHVVDPFSAKKANFQAEIQGIIKANGFAPLPLGPIGTSDGASDYCRVSVT